MKQQIKPHEDKKKLLLELEIEGLPPTVNHLYRTSRSGFRYKTERGRKYQEQISSQLAEKWQYRPPYPGEIELRIKFIVKTRRKWDIDNRVKALQDCLSMASLIEDDSQVQILHVERCKGEIDMTRLEIWLLEQ